MAFTDRFMELVLPVYDKDNSEMVGYSKDTFEANVKCKINPFEVSHYRETFSDDKNLDRTLIHFKNGDSFEIDITIDSFEKLLNEHQK